MTTWQSFTRSDAHGVALETEGLIAEIIEGRTDHKVLCVVEKPGKAKRERLFATREDAKSWVEKQLS